MVRAFRRWASNWLDMMRQRQVEIVAPRIRCSLTATRWNCTLPPRHCADADEREIRRAAANVANQNLLAPADDLFPILPWASIQCIKWPPAVPRSARRGANCPSRRLDRQFAGDFVERRRQCQHDILRFQRIGGKPSFHAARKWAKYRALTSTGESRSTSAAPCQGNSSASRSTPEMAKSHDLAD